MLTGALRAGHVSATNSFTRDTIDLSTFPHSSNSNKQNIYVTHGTPQKYHLLARGYEFELSEEYTTVTFSGKEISYNDSLAHL